VSVYGLGRFPVTLYQEQWLKLLDMAAEIRAFIRDNAGARVCGPRASAVTGRTSRWRGATPGYAPAPVPLARCVTKVFACGSRAEA